MINDHEKTNFNTLLKAAENGDLALVETTRKRGGARVILLCAMNRDDDGIWRPVPLAELVRGNPFKIYNDPTGGLNQEQLP
jgi:hypothetical protein